MNTPRDDVYAVLTLLRELARTLHPLPLPLSGTAELGLMPAFPPPLPGAAASPARPTAERSATPPPTRVPELPTAAASASKSSRFEVTTTASAHAPMETEATVTGSALIGSPPPTLPSAVLPVSRRASSPGMVRTPAGVLEDARSSWSVEPPRVPDPRAVAGERTSEATHSAPPPLPAPQRSAPDMQPELTYILGEVQPTSRMHQPNDAPDPYAESWAPPPLPTASRLQSSPPPPAPAPPWSSPPLPSSPEEVLVRATPVAPPAKTPKAVPPTHAGPQRQTEPTSDRRRIVAGGRPLDVDVEELDAAEDALGRRLLDRTRWRRP